jgi:hypothetical protein
MHKKLSLLLLLLFPIVANAVEITVSGKVIRILNYEGHQGPLAILDNMTATNGLGNWCLAPFLHFCPCVFCVFSCVLTPCVFFR